MLPIKILSSSDPKDKWVETRKRSYLVMIKSFVFLSLCVMALDLSAGVYKWVDSEGKVHFGDRPPAESDANEVKVRKSPSSAKGSVAGVPTHKERLENQQKMLEAFREEREAKKEAEQKKKEEDAKRKIECAYARDKLKTYTSSGSLYIPQADGSKKYLSEAARQKAIEQTRKRVKILCTGL